ncbi:hypothetical protein CDAR_611781 [Caerostris darwini]|uniref:Lectin n=1 Tax=Caerostris darwini TaxID=1538125 RepID=A0AAV4MSL0_9ARAC|nr:hypothetical protein CDAR_611781 [Caerostris darwini]
MRSRSPKSYFLSLNTHQRSFDLDASINPNGTVTWHQSVRDKEVSGRPFDAVWVTTDQKIDGLMVGFDGLGYT